MSYGGYDWPTKIEYVEPKNETKVTTVAVSTLSNAGRISDVFPVSVPGRVVISDLSAAEERRLVERARSMTAAKPNRVSVTRPSDDLLPIYCTITRKGE